ncbi:MAG: HAMP domain-containing sensor histidine kinase [Leptolyngbyaceae bacterium]|nr:HAMP domain-containing sensor histidine kinase [Leptolyngbyaceae bacterium]
MRLQTTLASVKRWLQSKVETGSLQFRLTVGATLIAILGTVLLSGWVSWRTEQILIGSHKQVTRQLVTQVPQDIEAYSYRDMSLDIAMERVVELRSRPGLLLVVADSAGEVLVHSDSEWYFADIFQSLTSDLQTPPFSTVAVVNDRHYAVCARPLVVRGQELGDLYAVLDITDALAAFGQLMWTLVLVNGLIMGLMLVVIALYVRRSLQPLRQMSQMTAHLPLSELAHYQFQLENAPTEVKQLASTCDNVLVRLASELKRQQQFVQDISHELRTPLSLVSGYLQSLLRRSNTLTEPQREALETAAEEADHTIHLLQNLLDLERAGIGSAPFTRSRVAVNPLVDDVVQMAIISSYRDIKIDLKYAQPIEVWADGDHLRQVLAQLVDNAIKYSDEAQLVTVRLDQRDGCAIIQVCDRGMGIPLQHQARIFDQCYRVDSSRSRTTGGCGLGLSLVKVLVEGMGGTVTVRSKPNEGSIFTVKLPTTSNNYYENTYRNRGRRGKISPVY